MAELCKSFMEDDSKKRNQPGMQEDYQGVIDRNIIPLLGRKKGMCDQTHRSHQTSQWQGW